MVSAGGTLTVNSDLQNTPYLGASSTANSDGDETLEARSKFTITGSAKVGVSLAVSVANVIDASSAVVAGNATLGAGGATRVTSTTRNSIDPSTAFGANLVTPFNSANTKPKYTTKGGSPAAQAGDTVELADGYAGGGASGTVYQYVGADNAQTDLSKEDYSNTDKWKSINLAANAVMKFIQALTTYLGSNFGLSGTLLNSTTQATAIGQDTLSAAGAITVLVLTHDATAAIRSGAQVNQGAVLGSGVADGFGAVQQ